MSATAVSSARWTSARTSSVAGSMTWRATALSGLWSERRAAARVRLAELRGLDLDLETKTCRKLVDPGCPAYGDPHPASALETIQTLGAELGPTVVVDVGYNDYASLYHDELDTVMHALVAAGVQHVVWVTLEEAQDAWVRINSEIRDAPKRWRQLVVADVPFRHELSQVLHHVDALIDFHSGGSGGFWILKLLAISS